MQIRTSCGRCKDSSCFQENKQLSLLVESYRKLCLYVIHSPLLHSISNRVGGSPEVMALLEEVLVSHEDEAEDTSMAQEEASPPIVESLTPTEAPPAPTELSAVPQSSPSEPPSSNVPQECNGELPEDLDPASPELEVCELVEEQPQAGLSASGASCGELKLSSVTTGPLAPTPGTVCSLRDGESGSRELEEGEVLLLSVEEVLQNLDPLQPGRDAPHTQPETHRHIGGERTHTPLFIQLDGAHNYTQIRADRTSTAPAGHGTHTHSSSVNPPPSSKPPPVRLKRKRSRSESDREKVKPLPIASILQGSAHQPPPALPPQTLHTPLPAPPPPAPPAHTYSSLPNGLPLKPSRPVPNHNKGARKHVDAAPKKPHSKSRGGGGAAGGTKAKDAAKDQRLVSGCIVPQAPVRPPYKKPAEKKGCKCGRATQNPSVLTCRGQRCPCYSNRKVGL